MSALFYELPKHLSPSRMHLITSLDVTWTLVPTSELSFGTYASLELSVPHCFPGLRALRLAVVHPEHLAMPRDHAYVSNLTIVPEAIVRRLSGKSRGMRHCEFVIYGPAYAVLERCRKEAKDERDEPPPPRPYPESFWRRVQLPDGTQSGFWIVNADAKGANLTSERQEDQKQ
ncbi:hypothetical protein VTO42DRAFT_7205 [Malbranchea cinnamomea]